MSKTIEQFHIQLEEGKKLLLSIINQTGEHLVKLRTSNLLYIPIIATGVLLFIAIFMLTHETAWSIIIAIIYTLAAALLVGQFYRKTRQYQSQYL